VNKKGTGTVKGGLAPIRFVNRCLSPFYGARAKKGTGTIFKKRKWQKRGQAPFSKSENGKKGDRHHFQKAKMEPVPFFAGFFN
jgi:hypothetical protein